MQRHRLQFALVVVAVLAAASAGAGDSTRWVNIHVEDTTEPARVEVRVPLNTVLALMEGVHFEHFDAGKVDIDMGDVTIDWPQVVAAVREAPDGQFVTVASTDADVQVAKRDAMLVVHVEEHGGEQARVDVTVPMALIDALSVDSDNRIDVRALLSSLDRLDRGELVRVEATDASVRIWID